MIKFEEKTKESYDALEAFDRDRLEPIVNLFAECVPGASLSAYNSNIFYLQIHGTSVLGISPRKNYISLYIASMEALRIIKVSLKDLGRANPGVGCLRFKKLSDINMETLKQVFLEMSKTEHTGAFGLNA